MKGATKIMPIAIYLYISIYTIILLSFLFCFNFFVSFFLSFLFFVGYIFRLRKPLVYFRWYHKIQQQKIKQKRKNVVKIAKKKENLLYRAKNVFMFYIPLRCQFVMLIPFQPFTQLEAVNVELIQSVLLNVAFI